MAFIFQKTALKDVIYIRPYVFRDKRGFFVETYKQPDFSANGIRTEFVQTNHNNSKRHVLRGLHFQYPPAAQAKLVGVIKGEIFDVAVDIRAGSPTFRQWFGITLSAQTMDMLYIPEGFAHGFVVMSEEAQIFYQCSHVYSPEHEQGLLWNDPDIKIRWPVKNPVLSDKDASNPRLKDLMPQLNQSLPLKGKRR